VIILHIHSILRSYSVETVLLNDCDTGKISHLKQETRLFYRRAERF
jgi:hypothetical protein